MIRFALTTILAMLCAMPASTRAESQGEPLTAKELVEKCAGKTAAINPHSAAANEDSDTFDVDAVPNIRFRL